MEWHGGLRWLWAPASAAAEVQAVALAAGGNASVFVNPAAAAQSNGVSAANTLSSDSTTLSAISQRLKASFDPQGLFNPGLVS